MSSLEQSVYLASVLACFCYTRPDTALNRSRIDLQCEWLWPFHAAISKTGYLVRLLSQGRDQGQ